MLPALVEAGRGYAQMLQPHIERLAEFAVTNLMPALESVGKFLGDNLPGVISVLAPIVTGLADVSLSGLELILKSIAVTWSTYLEPAFSAMGRWLGDLTGGWDNLKRGADRLMKSLKDIAKMLSDLASGKGLQIPEWLRAGLRVLGVPGFATGVQNFGGGLAIVGEQGPELLNLPRGSSVTSAPDTARLLAAPAPVSSGMVITIAPVFHGAVIDNETRLRQLASQIADETQRVTARAFGEAVDMLILSGGAR
jgi:hypothetical protein